MEFKEKKSIYMQIADYICENILNEVWLAEDRIPSVRELAVQIEVNPNTVMRSFAFLQEKGIIFNKRGIGYFVKSNARQIVEKIKKQEFIKKELPVFFKTIDLLGIELGSIEEMYLIHKNTRDNSG